MRSSTILLSVGLLATPLALLANPQAGAGTDGLMQLAQNTATSVPQQTINGRPLVDAPTAGPPFGFPPEYRVADPGSRSLNAGPINSTPFSAGPLANSAAGSPGTPNGVPGDAFVTPNLGK